MTSFAPRSLKLKTAPTDLPVSPDLVVAHSRLEPIGSPAMLPDTELVDLYIAAATSMLDGKDGVLGRALMTQTWVYKLDAFPDIPFDTRYDYVHRADEIWLPLPPLQSVTHIKYVNEAGTLTTLDPSLYKVTAGEDPAVIVPAYENSWPVTREQIEAVEIEFVAGYQSAAKVPAPIRQAILMAVEEVYNNRGETINSGFLQKNKTAERLVAPYRVYRNFF